MDITAEQIIGKQVYDNKHEKVGKVSNLYIDQTSHQPTWVTIKTGLLGGHENFVPLSLASIDEDEDALFVAADKNTVESAPSFETGRELMPGEQDRLYQYYRNVIKRDRQSAPSGTTDDQKTSGQTGRSDTADEDISHEPSAEDVTKQSVDALNADSQQIETGRASLKKYVITEPANVIIPLHNERLTVIREPLTNEERDDAMSGGGQPVSEEEHDTVVNQDDSAIENHTMPNKSDGTDTNQTTRDASANNGVRVEKLNPEDDSQIDD